MNRYGVIMAGGGGTRFWPLSRQKRPKQVINLTGKDLMINETIERMARVIPRENIFSVTSAEQAPCIRDAINGRVLPDHILSEPTACNTAACIGYAAVEITSRYGDGTMLVTPADHFIRDVDALSKVFEKALSAAEREDKLLTIGIHPDRPATGFGYIRFDAKASSDVKPVLEFREKPDVETAKKYVASGEYTWNSGMFAWKVSTILRKFAQYAPDIYAELAKLGEAKGTASEQAMLEKVYSAIRKISVDYAVMEPSAAAGDVLVIPAEFGWSDVGSWDMLSVLHAPDMDGNVFVGDVLAINAKENMCYSTKKLIALVDVSNLVVVETDDAIMICPGDRAQDVKLLVDEIRRQGRTELL